MRIRDGVSLLDCTLQGLMDGERARAMDGLFGGLLDLREEMPAEEWRRFSKETAVDHPLRRWIHEDPMTRRSFEKPRGYAGDAVLLDYIYGIRTPDPALSLARAVYDFAVERPAAEAVRRRRERIAERIDEIFEARQRPIRMLSIASGHLREGHLSDAVRSGHVDEFVAVDSDGLSCDVVRESFPGVTIRNLPFTKILREKELMEHFDFVYSAGLFDYLDERVGRLLTERMFAMLRPGGSLLLTNFLPTVVDAGYMETYMGWDLIYRTREDLFDLAGGIEEGQKRLTRTYADSTRTIGYLEVERVLG